MLALVPLSLSFLVPQDPVPPPQAMPVPRTLVLARGDHAIAVDGRLQDWPVVPSIRLDDTRQLSGTALGSYHGPEDLNAQAFMLWDSEYLWFAATVLDDVHLPLTEETVRIVEIPPTDALTLIFDPRRDTRAIGADRRRDEDSAHWLGDMELAETGMFRQDRLRGTARITRDGRIAVARDPERTITTYEARIPWAEILPDGLEAEVGTVIDLQIVIDDYDVPGVPLPDTRIGWTFGTGARIDPGLFGSMRLSSRVAGSEESFDRPDLPARPSFDDDPVPGKRYWIELHDRVLAQPPAVATLDTIDPEFAGGQARRELLVELDEHHARFPRVDFLTFQIGIHRRMVRESAGIIETGLPFYWEHVLGKTSRAARRDSPERGFRLIRLPHGGWLVRSKVASFLIDPAGFAIEKPDRLWDFAGFALLTTPGDLFGRQDQLLLRMIASKPRRRFFAHIEQYLPGVPQGVIERVVPGEKYEVAGLDVTVLGAVDERGWVTRSVGFQVDWPDGSSLVVSGTDSLPNMVEGTPDVLLLACKHPRASIFGQQVAARLTVLDGPLQCATIPGPAGRVPLSDAWELQRALRPQPTLLLAPGESFDSADAPTKR